MRKFENITGTGFFDQSLGMHIAEYPENHSTPWIRQDFFSIYHVVSGRGFFKTLQNKVDLRRGDVFFLNRGEPHSWQVNDCLHDFAWHFNANFLKRIHDFLPDKTFLNASYLERFIGDHGKGMIHYRAPGRESLQIRHTLKALLLEYLGNAGDREKMLHLDGGRIFLLYARLAAKQCQREPIGKTISVHGRKVCEKVILFVREHFHQKLTLESLASMHGLHPDYLSRIFGIHTGYRVIEYIQEVRIHAACDLMRSDESTILAIALKAGFESLSYFNKTFKKYTGMQPSEYRRLACRK